MATRRRRRKKKGGSLYQFCHEWGMIFLIVGGMAAWMSLPEGLSEPIGILLLASAVLLAFSDKVRPKPKRKR